MQKIAILCGSSVPLRPLYREEAKALGFYLTAAGFSVLCGGKSAGLMGHVARSILETEGAVWAIPTLQETSEAGFTVPLTRRKVVETLLQRKQFLFEQADAFVALPGGWETLGHVADVLAEKKAQLSSKPLVLLNTLGYWDRFLGFMVAMKDEGFLHESDTELFHLSHTAQEAITWLKSVL